jgi:hypothetical protein
VQSERPLPRPCEHRPSVRVSREATHNIIGYWQ